MILTERPCVVDLARDEQGRLHHPTGPVVGYPDGWGWTFGMAADDYHPAVQT